MLKVLQYAISERFSGPSMYMADHWHFMDKNRFVCDFVTLEPTSLMDPFFSESGAGIFYISTTKQDSDEEYFKELSRLLEAGGYSAVHFHLRHWTARHEKALRLFAEKGLPVLLHAHCAGASPEETAEHRRILQGLEFPEKTRLAACSTEAAVWMFGSTRAKSGFLQLKNAIDTERFAFTEERRTRVLKEDALFRRLDPEFFFLFQCARYDYAQKNQRFSHEVYQALGRVHPACLGFMGRGKDLLELYNFILKDGKHLFLYPGMPEAAFFAADAIILPSYYEGVSRVAVEAQAAGLHCFLSDTLSPEHKLTPLVHMLPLSASPEAWAGQILTHCVHKKAPRESQAAALKAAGYDIREAVKLLEELYEELGGSHVSR